MTDKNADTRGDAETGSWKELLSKRYLGTVVVLASGIALYAIDSFVVTSLLPTAVRDIGGQRYYAWASTVFQVASVLSATMVSRSLASYGPRTSYFIALTLFGAGMVVCSAAPTMSVFIFGRLAQGFGGGLLSGLGYAVINSALPSHLWARGSATVSAMWGVGTFVGPALGGLFAQIGLWRDAFWLLFAATALVTVLVPRAIPSGRATKAAGRSLPFAPLTLLIASVMLVSVAGIASKPQLTILAIIGAAFLLATAFIVDRRSNSGILPRSAYGPTTLTWIYLTIALLVVANRVETFVPLFGQRIGGLPPVVAGFLGAVLALGWTLSSIVSSRVSSPAATRRVIAAGPLLMSFGLLVTGAFQLPNPNWPVMVIWTGGLMAAGAGIGLIWPHLAARAMGAVADPDEANKASAAISTVQLIAGGFGAAISGVLVNLGGSDILRSAHLLFFTFAFVAALGCWSAVHVSSKQRLS